MSDVAPPGLGSLAGLWLPPPGATPDDTSHRSWPADQELRRMTARLPLLTAAGLLAAVGAVTTTLGGVALAASLAALVGFAAALVVAVLGAGSLFLAASTERRVTLFP